MFSSQPLEPLLNLKAVMNSGSSTFSSLSLPPHSKANIPAANTSAVNTATNGRDHSTLHGVYGTVAPVTATAAPNTGFIDMNRMYEVTNIKFDRSQPTAGEQIAAIGDAHLTKLEAVLSVLQSLYLCLLSISAGLQKFT
jgi:hypothetical protein